MTLTRLPAAGRKLRRDVRLAQLAALILRKASHRRRLNHERFSLGIQPLIACRQALSCRFSNHAANASNASRRGGGSALPRTRARLKIPLAARAESAYRSLTVISKTSDNEHSTAALGNSEVSSIDHPPGAAIPDFGQRCEKDSKVSAFGRGEEPHDIFKDNPSWPKLICDPCELKEETGALTLEACSLAGNAEVLAGESSAEKVDGFGFSVDGANVIEDGCVRPMPSQHTSAPLVDLGLPQDAHTCPLKAEVEAADP
jgi:hypothetical protein